jgi:hypothetical protein
MQIQEDDRCLELGLALSVSHEMERRRSGVIVSTQEYQEDERRREVLLNDSEEDIFEDSVCEEIEASKFEKRWVGENEEFIPESSNENVGRRPMPTVVVNLKNQTVNDSRLMRSLESTAVASR